VDLFPEFVIQKKGRVVIWGERRWLATVEPSAIGDPDSLFARADCKVIKDQRKIKVGKVTLRVDGASIGIYLKRYNAFSVRYRVLSWVVRSGAVRSLEGAAILRRVGIATGNPLASVEVRRLGMLDKSFFMSEEIVSGKTADAFWCEDLGTLRGVKGFRTRRHYLSALSAVFAQLHRCRVYHNDLKDANILVNRDDQGNERMFLLDLEGVRRCWYLSMRRRIKNLVQLNRTLGRFLTRTEKMTFLKSYLGESFDQESVKIKWVKKILEASQRGDQRSLAKNAA
jgi:tRNA A-37 threonylcarbamoyl transferase component Bud32